MMPSAFERPLTFVEYLAIEERNAWRHELVGGWLHPRAASTAVHNLLCVHFVARLESVATERGCRLYGMDLKLRIDDETSYYPDVMAVCDSLDREHDFITSPSLLIEVLSEDTEPIDRREKLLAYRRIPSLLDYLIVAQDRREIEHHQRVRDGAWGKLTLAGEGQSWVQCLDTQLSLERIYAGIVASP